MTTLLKAYLIGTNDPIELTNIFIDELKKDLRAYSQRKISEVYDIDEWNAEKKDILEAIEEWEEAIVDIKDDIDGRKKWIKDYEFKIREEKLKEEPDRNAIRRLQYALKKQTESNAKMDKEDKNTIRRHKRQLKLVEEELKYYDKWYKQEVGFSEEEWEQQPVANRLEILNESLDILNGLILEKEKEQHVMDPNVEETMKKEIENAKKVWEDFESQATIISEEDRKKYLDKEIGDIRSVYRRQSKFNAQIFQEISRLKARYENTLEEIYRLEEQAEKDGLDLPKEIKDKTKKRLEERELADSLKQKPSKWAKQIAEAEERRKKKLPLHHEKKKIWLEGGYPSWTRLEKDWEKPKRVIGFNERLKARGLDPIPINKFITDLYKNSEIDIKDLQKKIQDEYPRIMSDAQQGSSGSSDVGNWSNWEEYGEQLAYVLRKPKDDPEGDELLVRLQMLMRSLKDEDLKVWDSPAISGKTPHGLVQYTDKGKIKMGAKKTRVASLKSIRSVLNKALSELKLTSSQVTNIKYILDRIEWAIKEAPKEIVEEEEEDLTEQHQSMIELFHDAYDMALDIREAFPDDKEKTYEYEIIKVALEEIKELQNKIDSDAKPEKEELLDMLVNYELLSRKAEELEIPNWGPAKPEIEAAIDKLDKKLEKFYGELTDKDIKTFKEMLSQEGIEESKRRIKPRNFNYATERKKHVRVYITNAQRIAKKYRDKYIKSDVPINTEMFLRQLIDAYFPKYRVRKSVIRTIGEKGTDMWGKPDSIETFEQQELNTQRSNLIRDISKGQKISLKNYPLLYARGTMMENRGKWEEDGKPKGQATEIYNQIPVDYSKWREWQQDAEEEQEEIVGQISQDNNRILDDDEMEDFMDVVGEEADTSVAEEELRQHIKDKLGEDADERAVDEKIEEEKQKKLEQDIKALEGTDTDKALIRRMQKLLDDGKENLKEGENFSQFIKRILEKERKEKEKQPATRIQLPDERRIDAERREAEGVSGDEEQMDRLRDIIGDEN